MSNPISFGAFLGDWSRYIPKETSRFRIMWAVFAAQVATLVPFIFGLCTATIVAAHASQYIASNNYVGIVGGNTGLVFSPGMRNCHRRRFIYGNHGPLRYWPGYVQYISSPA
jgi:purine-cytosine permease-like protein